MASRKFGLAVAIAFGAVIAASGAHANVSVEETANATTVVTATNTQQTNIVSTITAGGTTTVRVTTGVTTTAPAGTSTINISVPSGGIVDPGAGNTVSLPTAGGGSVNAVSNGDGTFTIQLDGGGSVTVDSNGNPIEVNYLNGPGAIQSAMIEQFRFDRSNGFQTTQSGASAGGVDGKLSVWVNGSYSTFDEDQQAIDADGDTWAMGVGADWQFSDRFIAGLSLTGSLSDVTTTFNNGDIETTGITVSPYFVSILGRDRNILLDGAFGYTMNDNDATRSSGAITSSYDSSSWFVSSNISYIFNRNNFRFQPKVGVLWLDNTTDGYTESGGLVVNESGSKLGRLSAGVKLEYTANDRFTPFVSMTGEYDFETEDYSTFTGANRPSVEDLGAVLGAGFSAQLSDRMTGDVSGTTSLGRDDYSAYTLTGTLRFSF